MVTWRNRQTAQAGDMLDLNLVNHYCILISGQIVSPELVSAENHRHSPHNNVLIRSGEAPAIAWSRNMLYSGFNTLHRSVIRRQTGVAARITWTLSRSNMKIRLKFSIAQLLGLMVLIVWWLFPGLPYDRDLAGQVPLVLRVQAVQRNGGSKYHLSLIHI